jgi:acetylornithine deacetylase/succinyl-diaminopimelate desuccinylase-like protein
MSAPIKLRVHGRSGHGSMPGIADNALVKAARLIERLDGFEPVPEQTPEVEALLQTILGEVPPLEQVLELARGVSPAVSEMVEPLLSTTVSPTMVTASEKRNVIPGLCEVTVDCRILPGHTPDEIEGSIREALGDGDYDLEWGEPYGGTRSPLQTPLWDAVSSWVEKTEPGAKAVPICVAGFTDSHWVRQRFGTVAYGFFPMRAMDPELAARLIHSANERAVVEDLELGLDFLRHAAITIGQTDSRA